MKNVITFVLSLMLLGCSINDERIAPVHEKSLRPFVVSSLARIPEYYWQYSSNPVRRDAVIININSSGVYKPNLTYQVYVASPQLTNTTPNDSLFYLVGSQSGVNNNSLLLNLSTSYPTQFGSVTYKEGQYIPYKYQWIDSSGNISNKTYKSIPITLQSDVLSSAGDISDQWNHFDYNYSSFEVVHFDTTFSLNGTKFVTPDTLFTNKFFLGVLEVDMTSTGTQNMSTCYKMNDIYDSSPAPSSGYCFESNLSNLDFGDSTYTILYSTLRFRSESPCIVHYKFDGIKLITQ